MPPTTDLGTMDDATRQSLVALVERLPTSVRDFVTGSEPDAVVLSLSRKYQMHADQAGMFHQALLLLLLGVYDPERFVAKLSAGGLSDETIRGVVADLNETVFAPLRAAESAASAPAPVAARPPVVSVPAPLASATPAIPSALPSAPPIPDPFAAMTRPSGAAQAPQPFVPTPIPQARTMAHDIETMQSGAAAPVRQPAPPVQVPAGPVADALPPRWSAPVSAPQETPSFAKTSVPAVDPKELTDTLKKYGIDPYREPVE